MTLKQVLTKGIGTVLKYTLNPLTRQPSRLKQPPAVALPQDLSFRTRPQVA